MKKRIKDIIIGLVVGIVITASPVFASGVLTKIDVVLNGINVQLEGQDVQVDSILHKGTTYLPMRKVVELVDKDIDWNPETKTANIVNEKKEEIIITPDVKEDKFEIIKGDTADPLIITAGGIEYYSWKYIAKDLLNDEYNFNGIRDEQNIVSFYNDNTSFEVECKVFQIKIYISKENYEKMKQQMDNK